MPVTWHEERRKKWFWREHVWAWAWRVCCVVLFFSKIKIHDTWYLEVKFYVIFLNFFHVFIFTFIFWFANLIHPYYFRVTFLIYIYIYKRRITFLSFKNVTRQYIFLHRSSSNSDTHIVLEDYAICQWRGTKRGGGNGFGGSTYGHGHGKCVALCCFLVKLKYTILDILKVKFYVIFFKKIFMFLFLFLFLNLQIWYIPIILELHFLVLWVPLMYVSKYTLINHFKNYERLRKL